jgi:hypothetical protein
MYESALNNLYNVRECFDRCSIDDLVQMLGGFAVNILVYIFMLIVKRAGVSS